MPKYSVTGEFDPFLHVTLSQGEKIFCESGSMVMMDTTLDLTGQMKGGFFSAITRKLVSGESFFQQHIHAARGDGEVLLSPNLPGAIEVIDVGPTQYLLNDGAFLAASETVELRVKSQGLGKALMGGTGGFFVMETAGTGKIAIAGFGSIFAFDVSSKSDVIVDNVHVLAWDKSLDYSISLSTSENKGFLSNLINSATSGEGLVNRFRGNGKIYVCSRNREGFSAWLASLITDSASSKAYRG